MKPKRLKPLSREELLLCSVKDQLLHEDDDKFPVPKPKPSNEAQHIDQLNRLPLNQEAEAWLRKAGEKPDPDFLYLLLLLQWGLGSGLQIKQAWEADALAFLEKLLSLDDQEKVYRFLLTSPGLPWPQEALLHPGSLAQCKSPLEAAQRVLDAFLSALKGDENLVPSFPPDTPN